MWCFCVHTTSEIDFRIAQGTVQSANANLAIPSLLDVKVVFCIIHFDGLDVGLYITKAV